MKVGLRSSTMERTRQLSPVHGQNPVQLMSPLVVVDVELAAVVRPFDIDVSRQRERVMEPFGFDCKVLKSPLILSEEKRHGMGEWIAGFDIIEIDQLGCNRSSGVDSMMETRRGETPDS